MSQNARISYSDIELYQKLNLWSWFFGSEA